MHACTLQSLFCTININYIGVDKYYKLLFKFLLSWNEKKLILLSTFNVIFNKLL